MVFRWGVACPGLSLRLRLRLRLPATGQASDNYAPRSTKPLIPMKTTLEQKGYYGN